MPSSRPRPPSPLRALLRAAVEYNPLFLLSALAILGGVWLLNPPGASGGRPAGEALPLLFAVRGYELALLVAMLLLRRAGLMRDVRGLGLVLTPFLLDVSRTHALAALLPETWPGTIAACLTMLGLTGALALAAGHLTGRRFSPLVWAGLLTPVALSLGLPLLGSYLTYQGLAADDVTLACGLGLALAVGAVSAAAGAGADARLLGGVALGVLTSHVLGTAWSHSGDPFLALGPALIALGPGLPRLLWPARDDAWTPLALPALGALCCAGPGTLGASWWVGLSAFAVLAGIEAVRRRGLPQAIAALLALDLLVAGAQPGLGWGAVGSSAGEPLALLALFGWALQRRAHPLLLGGTLGLAGLLLGELRAPLGGDAQALLGLDVVGVGALVWSHRRGIRAASEARLLGVMLLIGPAQFMLAPGVSDARAPWVGAGTLLALLAAGLVLRVRLYQLPALLLPLAVFRRVAPSGTGGWGALGIAGGFGLVGLGVVLSLQRQRLLSLLDDDRERPTPDDDESQHETQNEQNEQSEQPDPHDDEQAAPADEPALAEVA